MTRHVLLYLAVAVAVSAAVLTLVWTAGVCDVRPCGGGW